MNVLLTGATGYIGKQILVRLLAEGHFCRCLVRRKSGADSLKNLPRVELFYGDVTQKETLTGICEGIDVVIHSAGTLAKWNSSINELRPVNADGISNLSEDIMRNPVNYVIHISAGGVTGPVIGPPADETYICHPRTPYEKSKWEGEKNARLLFETYNLPVAIVRPTFTYGPGDPHKLELFRAIKKRRFVFIGSGDSTNHPVYIDDLVTGIMLLLEKRIIGETFILGGSQPVTKEELVYTIAEELGVRDNFLYMPRLMASYGALGMVLLANLLNLRPILTPSRVSMMADDWGYSITKAREILGYDPKVDLKTGVRNTVQSYTQLQWL